MAPPRQRKHRYHGVLAPNAKLRAAVTATAGPAGAVLQVLEEARETMGIGEPAAVDGEAHPLSSDEGEPTEAPAVLPARSPPQGELEFVVVDQTGSRDDWPEIDQSGDSEHAG